MTEIPASSPPISKATPELTSYDLLKTLAIITMIIDHVGLYFFPELSLLRAIGRMSFPIWFFLIGYARTERLDPRLCIGGIIILCSDLVFGYPVFPLNILLTLLLIRHIRKLFMRVALVNIATFFAVLILLVSLIVPTYGFIEYSTQGMLFVLYGYILRRKPFLWGIPGHYLPLIITAPLLLLSYVFQHLLFEFTTPEAQVMYTLGIGAVILLTIFRPQIYPRLTQSLPQLFTSLLQFTGRRTLEIYVVHVLLFRAIVFFW